MEMSIGEVNEVTIGDLVADLTYLNYAHNRRLAPHITPHQWEKVYGPRTMLMEERYQQEPK